SLDLFLHADWTGSASFPQSSFGDYEQIAFGGRLDYQISPFSSWTFLGNYKSDSLVDYMFGENLQVHDEGSMDLRYERFLGSGKDMMARVFRRWDRMGYGFSDHRSQSRGMEVQLNLDAGSHQLVVGGNLAYAEVESTDLPDPKPSREWALYGQDIYSLQENFDLVLGTRLDSFSRFGVALSPRLGGVFRLNDETSIHFSVAKAFRAPTFNELYYKSQGSYNEGTYKYKWDDSGNPNLDPERAWGYEVGLRHGSVEDSLSLALFQRDVKDLISWVYSQEEYREDGKQVILYKTRVQNTSQARIRGGEVEWTKTSASGSEAKLGYTYLDAVDMDTHWPLAHIPRHQGWLSLAGRIAEGTSMQWQTVFVDKRPTGMGDLAPYAVMDVTLGQEINDQLEVNLQIENLLDEKYEEQFSYPAPPRSYILGLKYSF
ncbi:MAG: TonB-dependent receptor plug domain-containing protein, partial [Limnochordia bacterium]